ncbi:MAG: aminopeptidase P family protein [Chloroflexota bacterium]|nr:aminopeptidase P family protein [Chloroflexota bacterium]
MFESRLRRLATLQSSQALDCVALMPAPNLHYLTGLAMHPSERPTLALFPVQGPPAFILPLLEAQGLAENLPFEVQLFPYTDDEGPQDAFQAAGTDLGLAGKRIGVEFLQMRVMELRRLEQAAPGCHVLAFEAFLQDLRICKGDSELEQMRRAIRITEQALSETIAEVYPGRTEEEIATELRVAMLRAGAEEVAFIIAVSGPRTASPHARSSSRPLEQGDVLVVDCGAMFGGYVADITRTFAVGDVPAEVERVYDVVRAANEAGRAAVRPGVLAQEVDRAARRVIAEAGYGEYFIHRTGHGLGLEVHEPPYIVEGNEDLLRPGMTFTVEPGIYIPGLGGVRIEDDVVVTPSGAETLTTYSRELVHL